VPVHVDAFFLGAMCLRTPNHPMERRWPRVAAYDTVAFVPIRALLSPFNETLQDMESAADDRFWEGLELATQGRLLGALYVWGYVAEMLLKVGAFRVDGASPGEMVGPRLGPAKVYGKARFSHIGYESGHSVEFWAAFLREKRVDAGRPFSAVAWSDLALRASNIHARWLVSLRYRSLTLPPLATSAIDFQAETLQMSEDIGWILNNRVALRS
jgi:hypothetical protein